MACLLAEFHPEFGFDLYSSNHWRSVFMGSPSMQLFPMISDLLTTSQNKSQRTICRQPNQTPITNRTNHSPLPCRTYRFLSYCKRPKSSMVRERNRILLSSKETLRSRIIVRLQTIRDAKVPDVDGCRVSGASNYGIGSSEILSASISGVFNALESMSVDDELQKSDARGLIEVEGYDRPRGITASTYRTPKKNTARPPV